MNKLTLIKSITSASILAAALISQSTIAAEKITFEDFTKMSYEQRVQVCAEFVNSSDIGLCAAITAKPDMAATVAPATRNKALVECAKEENTTSPQDLSACVNDKLNTSEKAAAYTDKEFHAALKKCAKDKSLDGTNEVLQCTYGKLKN
ncbi:hypothetical protein [Psychromonas sp. MME1]|uniref:hypothetical protein n=1 Tax=Psychromonas sp. MME1 TaxID=3231032 RepID=UPI0034E2DA8C